jgi:hypothetical protein
MGQDEIEDNNDDDDVDDDADWGVVKNVDETVGSIRACN